MKKLSFLALAAVALLFGACASDKDDGVNVGQNVEENADQYIALSINLPTTSQLATRNTTDLDDNNYEDGNFELNDGLASEYAVKDALLVVFHPAGTDEDAATFVGAFEISPEPWTTSSDHQVTKTSAKIVQKVGSTVAAGDLALVILNRNSLVAFAEPNLTVGGAAFPIGSTYKKFRESIFTTTALGAAVMTSSGFYMANAPLTDKKGSTTTAITGAKVRTLIPIQQVYQTEAEALASTTPADIYVERGMAKVTLQALSSTLKLGSDATKAVAFLNWTIDHTNTKSYAVRSTEGHSDFLQLVNQVSKKYRYAGMTDITEGNPGDYKYRTYFAKDPNFNAPVSTVAPFDLSYAATSDYTDKIGDNNPQYCFENTFNVDNQEVMNTTLVRLKVKVGDGSDLYIVNENRGTIYNNAGVVTLAKTAAIDYIATQAGLGAITVSGTIDASDFDVTVTTAAGAATVTITQSTTLAGKISSGTVTNAHLQTAVNTALKTVACYAGGESYYTIRIKHFGDQLTPWHTGVALETPAPVVGDIYPTSANRDNNYLGRYGVLRNNWYDIRISSIQYLGEPTPKDYTNDTTTDDELDGYIAARIHILSWAKRIQNWDI